MERKERTEKTETRERGPMHFDFKDVALLSKHLNPHARMHSRRRTTFKGREQRLFAQAVKRARFMALMPYITR
jgi:small subunit ribosomal protein S18